MNAGVIINIYPSRFGRSTRINYRQTPAPLEEVAVGYSVGVTVSGRDFAGPGP